MKIMIVDRDRNAADHLKQALEDIGHDVVYEPSKTVALQRLEEDVSYDLALIDPAPQASARPMAMQLRWRERSRYLYLMAMTHNPDVADIVRSGLNDYIKKPFTADDVKEKIGNAQRLVSFHETLTNGDEIYTHGAIFGKRPFVQLLLSALDRTYRYAEQAFLLRLQIDNFADLVGDAGSQKADAIAHDFSSYVSHLRRMSDFVGRTDSNEFVLLMQRPEAESEPVDAAQRFIVALKEYKTEGYQVSFRVQLLELPMANILMESIIDENGLENRLR